MKIYKIKINPSASTGAGDIKISISKYQTLKDEGKLI